MKNIITDVISYIINGQYVKNKIGGRGIKKM
jgi:hypothetical protein